MFKSFVRAGLIFVFMLSASVPVEADEKDRNWIKSYIGVLGTANRSSPAAMFEFSNHKNGRKFTFQSMEFFGGTYRDLSLLYGFVRKGESHYTSISAGIHYFDDKDDVYDTTGLAYELEAVRLLGREKKFGLGIKLRGSVNSIAPFSGIMFGMELGF